MNDFILVFVMSRKVTFVFIIVNEFSREFFLMSILLIYSCVHLS